jgi:hypothetical protein
MATLLRAKTRAGANRLWEIAREHPLPALTVGLGLGWIVVETARGGPLLPPLPTRRRRAAGEWAHEQGKRLRGGFAGLLEERPLLVGAASLALGVLAGLALPSTRREDELLGDARDELLESAREAGKEAIQQGKEAATGAVERVKESVREQELTPEQLAGKARHLARDTADALRDAERQVARSLGAEPPAQQAGAATTAGAAAPGSLIREGLDGEEPPPPRAEPGTPPRL